MHYYRLGLPIKNKLYYSLLSSCSERIYEKLTKQKSSTYKTKKCKINNSHLKF